MTDPKNPDQDEANGNDPTDSLPPGVPEPPDMAKVNDLRERMNRDRSARAGAGRGILRQDRSQQARDVGTYTIIPMMMIAGPLVGYLLGKGIENIFGRFGRCFCCWPSGGRSRKGPPEVLVN